jgi:hypothetical protein
MDGFGDIGQPNVLDDISVDELDGAGSSTAGGGAVSGVGPVVAELVQCDSRRRRLT